MLDTGSPHGIIASMESNLHWNEEHPLRELSLALARCNDPELMEDFLLQLFTPSEVQEMGKRWALVCLLDEGMSQRTIAKELGLSLCKITRGSKELKKEDSAFKKMIDSV
jgi:TrpR family trp operon transcriptional repressor